MPWKDALQRVELGEKPTAAPASLRTWSSQTLYGLFGGMLFGGYRGLVQARNRAIPSPVPTKSVPHRLAVFFVHEGILTGARVGVFASFFSAIALAAEAVHGASHPLTNAAAGAITCGLFGGATAGRVAVPAAAGFGAVTAGAAGAAQAGLQDALDGVMGEECEADPPVPEVIQTRLQVRDVIQAWFQNHALKESLEGSEEAEDAACISKYEESSVVNTEADPVL